MLNATICGQAASSSKKAMKNKILTLAFALLFLFQACNVNNNDAIDREINLTEKASKLVKADNLFGLELFQKITESDDSDNIMVSPLSVSLALAMTYNGADGETKLAMESTLKLNGLSTSDINESYYNLVEALKSLDDKVLLEIANSIYFREGFEVEPGFISTNENYYDADVEALDFGSPESVGTINNWVANKTHQKITRIIDNISADDVMFLLNAIYFKGIWSKEFNSESTTEFPFTYENGTTENVEMMCKLDQVDYTKNDLFSAICLPYGSGNYNMYVFLPESGKSVTNIIDELSVSNWETWTNNFAQTDDVDIKLPKFKFEYEKKLNDILIDMGMGIAFGGNADFTGINKNGGLAIDFVKHKTFVDVNEEGTEAAAVTIVGIRYTSVGNNPEEIPFTVNKPFLFAVTEKDTEAILFIGKVSKPEYEN